MSSMIKKKGSLVFKPKAPISRPRPAASNASSRASVPVAQRLLENDIATPNTASGDETIGVPERSIEASQSDGEGQALSSALQTGVEQSLADVALETSGRQAPSESTIIQPCQTRIEAVADNVSASQVLSCRDGATSSDVDPSLQPTTAGIASEQPLEPVRTVTPEPLLGLSIGISIEVQGQESVSRSVPETDAPPQTEIPLSSTTADATSTSTNTTRVAPKGPGANEAKYRGSDKQQRQRKTKPKPKKNIDDTAPRPRTRKRKTSNAVEEGPVPNRGKRRARSPTPEDAETQTVDLQQLTMADLTKDLRIGKKFSRHDELRDRERQLRIKAKLGKDGGTQSQSGDGTPVSPGTDSQEKSNSSTPASSDPPASAPPPTAGPQFRIVDGQIVVDQSSLIMDRHARAAATQQDLETIEENDFTRLTTSSSYRTTSKLKGPNVWSVDETELFYRGLSMFGTEFEMISRMFPGKQRRHVKLKFNREERHNPKRIDAALVGEKTTKMDIEEYRAFTGVEFESVETIEAQQRKMQEDFEAQQQRKADEQAEEMRKRREELFADDDAKKKKGRKKFKQAVSYGLNGEPIVQPS